MGIIEYLKRKRELEKRACVSPDLLKRALNRVMSSKNLIGEKHHEEILFNHLKSIEILLKRKICEDALNEQH